MNLRQMFPRLTFDASDLLDFAGDAIVPVTIEDVTYKTAAASNFGEAKIDYFLVFRELKRPIRLKGVVGDQLAAILGSFETDDWIGRVVGMRAHQITVPDPAGGTKQVWVPAFFAVAEGARPVLPLKTDIAGYKYWAPHERERLHRAMGQLPPAPGGAGHDAESAPMGVETAAKIVVSLKRRAKSWDDLVAHCKDVGAGALIDGHLPPDCPIRLVKVARAFVASLGAPTVALDETAETARLVASWTPPPTSTVDGDVVDVTTGEVIDDPDIPF